MPVWLLKFGPYILGLALLGGLWGWGHHAGSASANLSWQARWQARDLADAKAVAAETARQQAAEAAHKAQDEVILRDKDKAISDALAANGDLAHRLRLATTAHGNCPVSSTAPATGGTAGTGAGNGGDAAIESATQAVFDACIDAAARLTGLQREFR
jgi:hypothetical protein